MPASVVFQDVPPSNEQSNTPVQLSDRRTERDIAVLADLDDQKLSYREIAAKHDIGLGTVAAIAAKWKPVRNITAKFMVSKALARLDDWETASAEAAKKGDHRPAKDWLLHAQEIEPIADSPKLGIQINVGNGGAPVQAVNDIPTISVQPVDPKALTGE